VDVLNEKGIGSIIVDCGVQKEQLLTHLNLVGLKLGYPLSFDEELMKDGITRIINGTL